MKSKTILLISIKLSLIFYTVFFPAFSNADYVIITDQNTSDIISSLGNINDLMIIDNYYPLTHFSEGTMSFTISATIYKVNDLYDIRGRGSLSGWNGVITYNYALSNSIVLFAALSRTYIQGTVKHYAMDNTIGSITDGSAKLYSAPITIGYDIINCFLLDNNSHWSIPLHAGIMYQRYEMDFYYTRFTEKIRIHGSENLIRPFISLTLSRKFNVFSINFSFSPYLLYIDKPLNGEPAISAKFEDSPSSEQIGTSYPLIINSERNIYPGLNLTYLSDSNWSLTTSISGLVGNKYNYYNDIFLSGLSLVKYSIAFTYYITN